MVIVDEPKEEVMEMDPKPSPAAEGNVKEEKMDCSADDAKKNDESAATANAAACQSTETTTAAGTSVVQPVRHQIPFYLMNPEPKRYFLTHWGCNQLIKLAMVNNRYRNWVRAHFFEMRCMTIRVGRGKVCVSREPCKNNIYRCGHRIIRNIRSFELMMKLNLLNVENVFLESHYAPKRPRLNMHATKKFIDALSHLSNVYVDISEEKHFRTMIEELLERCDETLEHFYVRRKTVDNTTLNFPKFLSRSLYGKEVWPTQCHTLSNPRKATVRIR